MFVFDEYGARHQFDAFCKTVLRHEAISYFRELSRQRERAILFSALSQYEMDKLYTADEYPSDKFVFSAFGHVLYVESELVANAFAGLPDREQQILILHCVLKLPDREVGVFVGLSRSVVQWHRIKILNELRRNLRSKGVKY